MADVYMPKTELALVDDNVQKVIIKICAEAELTESWLLIIYRRQS
jgi:hypothetical protein